MSQSDKIEPLRLHNTVRVDRDANRWATLACGLVVRSKQPGPLLTLRSMLCAARFLDNADTRWLTSHLGPSLTTTLNAQFSSSTSTVPELIESARDVISPASESKLFRAWFNAARLLAFSHRLDRMLTPADIVAAFVSGRALSARESDYVDLPVSRELMADAFLAHVRTVHADLRFTFEYAVTDGKLISCDELDAIVSQFTPTARQSFWQARLESREPNEFLRSLLAKLDQEIGLRLLHEAAKQAAVSPGNIPLETIPIEAAAWLENARALASRAHQDRVNVHHLAAAALRRGRRYSSDGESMLSAALDQAAIPENTRKLVEIVGASRGDEAQVFWDYFVIDAPVPPAAPLYQSDLTNGTDRLNFEADAKAVALLAVAPGVPPLSVGVFGEWGTGKSFFMRRVREHAALDDVLQIEFNAWHYGEGNLFASLAHRVFTTLREHMGTSSTNPLDDALPAALRSETARNAAEAATARRGDIEAQVKARQQELNDRRATMKDVAVAGIDVAATPEADVAKADPAAKEQIEQAKAKLRVQVAEGWKLARAKVLRLRVIIPLIVATAAIVTLIVTVPALRTWGVWVGALAATITPWIVVGSKYVKTAWRYANKAKVRFDALERALDESKRRNDSELRRLALALSTAIVTETDAKARSAAVNEELARHLSRVKNSGPMERLDALVRDRFESGTYRKMLGVVEQVRSDLETLSVLLAPDHDAQRRRELLAKYQIEESELPKLRRIILYIDDLDRCPADKVVEVLQAVHLLLAFPLFVVFVAVDPRWGITSIERSYEQLAPSPSGSITSATGFDYLEKIFQIPLWIRAMASDDATRLLGDYLLIRSKIPPDGAATPDGNAVHASSTTARVSTSPSPTGQSAAGKGASASDAVAASISAIGLDRVRVSPEEFSYAELLAGSLGSSPRRVKRFANLYRLVKAMLSGYEWHGFDLDDAHACLTLLAIQTGAPSVAPEVLNDLITGVRAEAGPEHLEIPALNAPRSPRLDTGDLERAKQIVRIYAAKTRDDARHRLAHWAPRISRLSFRRDAVKVSAPQGGLSRTFEQTDPDAAESIQLNETSSSTPLNS